MKRTYLYTSKKITLIVHLREHTIRRIVMFFCGYRNEILAVYFDRKLILNVVRSNRSRAATIFKYKCGQRLRFFTNTRPVE